MRRSTTHKIFTSTPKPFKINRSENIEQNVWVVNDDGHPQSPLSIERLWSNRRVKTSNVARGQPNGRVRTMANRRKEIPPNGEFPFFIDKTPCKELKESVTNERCLNQNDSVLIMDSPSVSTGNERNASKTAQPSRRNKLLPLCQPSVDTVDLCSDNEEEHLVVNSKKRKKNAENKNTKRRKSVQKADSHQPDIIILDDGDEPASKVCDNSVCVIEESVQLNLSSKCQQEVSSLVTSTKSGNVGYSNLVSKGNNKGSLEAPCLNPFSYPPPGTSNGTTAGPSKKRKKNMGTLKNRVRELCNVQALSSKAKTAILGDLSGPSGAPDEGPSGVPPPTDEIGSNVFIPYGNKEQTGLRPIIIDGCNVAIGHGGDRTFSVRGICICVEYFLRRGHPQVVALVPLHHRSKVSPHDREVLESLRNNEHLVYTPSRYIDNRLISSYDDRFIVQYAVAVGGVIVSRDNYRDLLTENPAWRDTITNRLLMPTWVGDMLMFPVDPMGKNGPTLDEFLRFPNK